jgi:hypothetical protein
VPELRARVLAAAREAGRDPAEITCAYNVEVELGGAVGQPTVVSGSPEAVTDRLLGFLALGFTALNFIIPGGPGSMSSPSAWPAR